jgi:hypothetical protein
MHRMDNGQADETIDSDSQAMTVTEMNTRFAMPISRTCGTAGSKRQRTAW